MLRQAVLSLLPIIALTSFSCATAQKEHCSPQFSYNQGYQDGRNGDASQTNLHLGSACEGGYTEAAFQKDYRAGFDKGKSEFCSNDRITAIALEDGQKLGPKRNSEFLNICPAKMSSSLKKKYDEQYMAGVKRACSNVGAFAYGVQDARDKADMAVGPKRFQNCVGVSVSEADLLRSYSKGYNETRQQLARDEELALQKQAMQEEIRLREKKQDDDRRLREIEIEEQHRTVETIANGLFKRDGNANDISNENVFRHGDNEIHVSCLIEGRKAKIKVTNKGTFQSSITGPWEVYFFDSRKSRVSSEKTDQSLSCWGGSPVTFELWSIPFEAKYCGAIYRGKKE